ncbi:helix-turn-helix domain-containing protein [Actinokineospora enzanensis]|uniref:helix-turn-helix domain-containing protein n=1 Tax=Actinokineospora enzanensis TaxID=155975 RepID=UPI000365145E|nr:helix-turn-helix domain-containing protein [Actinokineospora enzanensis]
MQVQLALVPRRLSVDRSACVAKRHGDEVAYQGHGCRCEDAREANRLYRKRLRENRSLPRLVDATGTRRRIQALMVLGWSLAALTARLGLARTNYSLKRILDQQHVRRTTAERVSALYDELWGCPGPSDQVREVALAAGYCSALAWDDETIDDPTARPVLTGTRVRSRDDVDEVVVDRMALGRYLPDQATIAEREAVVALLAVRERATDSEIAVRTGISERTVLRIRGRLTAGVPAATVHNRRDQQEGGEGDAVDELGAALDAAA